MWPEKVDASICANRWRGKYAPVFGDRTGAEFLRDPSNWVLSVPFVLPMNVGGAVISDIMIGTVEVPQECQGSIPISTSHIAVREAYLLTKARPHSRRHAHT